MQPAPPPPSALGKYRLLSPTAAVRVSPLCLGAMSIGDAWERMGTQSKENSFKILDSFYDMGGNFVDTANMYQNEQSEIWLGEWMAKRQNRSQMAGKVLYLGASDTPSWVVAKANQYARDHGLRQFSVYQGRYNAAQRDAERDIMPMLRDEGMAFAPFAALGGGRFKTKEQVEAMEKAGDKGRAFNEFIKAFEGSEGVIRNQLVKLNLNMYNNAKNKFHRNFALPEP
ncbi:unnamed protein product [Didymodactylos carnosus]|uniref:NADP-dependent oxidoreductase domain-containing protein n=1 Tax=Didymodactylos carnosus TaxID=1234261 RepID=A0A814SLP5_9BILA|nr:unnamed protein product [Didymodactylos carnosus]CAF1178808.1 unnamed protein product [Didymodactylos carnosus]CAF3912836.1 unnamed protein product [Didymodactylos carnosus]CAF3990196.1 unnamed protein product [Didymodactylos carnosus]